MIPATAAEPYVHTVEVRWADCDANQHARHTAFSDWCAHVRFSWLEKNGFPLSRFQEMGFGPVIFEERTTFFREVAIGETVSIAVLLAGKSSDDGRWRFSHDIRKANGKLAARHVLTGGWLDRNSRKLTAPPADLGALFSTMPRTRDWEELPRDLLPRP